MPKHSQKDRLPADGFVRRVLIASVIFISLVFLALFLWYSIYVLFLLFGGVLVAILLRTLAELVRHVTRLSHRLSLVIVLVLLAGAGVGLWFLFVPRLAGQFAQLATSLPAAWENFQREVQSSTIGKLVLDQTGASTQPATMPATRPGILGGSGGIETSALLGRFGGFITTALDVIAAVVVVLFTGLFLAFDPALYVRGAIRLVPPAHRIHAGVVLGAIGYTLKWWLIGQGVTMTIIALATWIGLAVLGVPLALALGVIAGLFNFIPNFGPLFSAVPATLLALTIGPDRAIAVIVLFIVLQNIEGYVLTPLIQRKAVDLPPALGIIAQILLGILVGAVGLVLAWPMAAAVVLAVKMLYVEDILGDELPTPDDENKQEVRDAKREARSVENDEKKE